MTSLPAWLPFQVQRLVIGHFFLLVDQVQLPFILHVDDECIFILCHLETVAQILEPVYAQLPADCILNGAGALERGLFVRALNAVEDGIHVARLDKLRDVLESDIHADAEERQNNDNSKARSALLLFPKCLHNRISPIT